MANVGTIQFFNARVGDDGQGLEISQLGSGVFDHFALYGINGQTSAIEVGSWQDTTTVAQSDGTPFTAPLGSSGWMTNNKRVGASGVSISGLPEGPYDVLLTEVNKHLFANEAIAPDFLHRNSGTLLIVYTASGVSNVNIFNPKAFAFDATGALTDAPPDISVAAYEINASGQWFSAATSGVWQNTEGQNAPIFMANRSTANNWLAANVHYFVLGVSVKPNSVGVLDDWNFAFQLQFA